jgi:flotillin
MNMTTVLAVTIQSLPTIGLSGVLGSGVVLGLVLFFGAVFLFVSRYKRCPANRILVVSGRVGEGRSAKVIAGGGTFVWPVIQEAEFMSLEPMQIDIRLTDALSAENIRVAVPSVFTIAIGTDEDTRQNAAQRLLGLKVPEIMKQAEDIIFGQLRQVIASMKIEEINRDRDTFLSKVMHNLEPELQKIGLVLLNVNIKDLNDASGYIEAIGQKAAAEAVQKARGDVAEQEKLGEVRVAQAEQERTVQVADANKVREIGVQEAKRDQAVRIAELERETAVAAQRALFLRDTEISEAEQAKRVAVAEADARAVAGEAESEQQRRVAVAAANAQAVEGETRSQAQIAEAKAQLHVREAKAFQQGETERRLAEGAVKEAEHEAQARAAVAEARRIEAERRAALEAPAKAEKAKRLVEAEAEAESRRIEAAGEADAIFAKQEAEARGHFEQLARKGEGLREIVMACGDADAAYKMLLLEHLDHIADKAAEAISNIKIDKIVVWENNGAGAGSNTANFLQGMAGMLPPIMQVVEEIGGVKLPNFVGQRVEGSPNGDEKVPVPAVFESDGSAPSAGSRLSPESASRETVD